MDIRIYAQCTAEQQEQLSQWVLHMEMERDGELGPTDKGAHAWLLQKLALCDGPFQTFAGFQDGRVCWTGSVIKDDRGIRAQLEELNFPIDGMLGLFNTRHDLRGIGIGWEGFQHVDRFLQGYVNSSGKALRIGLFTNNPGAKRHYTAVGYISFGLVYVEDFDSHEELFIKMYQPAA